MLVLLSTQGCVTKISADQIKVTSGYVTNGGTGARFESKPVSSVHQTEMHYVMTNVHWEPITQGAGIHSITWNWYSEGNKLVATRSKDLNFDKTPYNFWYRFPASSFAVGNYRVDTIIDATLVHSTEFEVIP